MLQFIVDVLQCLALGALYMAHLSDKRRKDSKMGRVDNEDEDGAVCTKCGTVVDNAEDWDKYHRHGR